MVIYDMTDEVVQFLGSTTLGTPFTLKVHKYVLLRALTVSLTSNRIWRCKDKDKGDGALSVLRWIRT